MVSSARRFRALSVRRRLEDLVHFGLAIRSHTQSYAGNYLHVNQNCPGGWLNGGRYTSLHVLRRIPVTRRMGHLDGGSVASYVSPPHSAAPHAPSPEGQFC